MGSGSDGAGPHSSKHPLPDERRDAEKTRKQLIAENHDLRKQLAELQNALAAVGAEERSSANQLLEEPGSDRRLPFSGGIPSGIARILAERERAYANLRRQFDFTRAITDSLGEGVIGLDHAGRVTFLNPAAKQMLGWSSGELIGKPMHERIHQAHREAVDAKDDDCPFLHVLRSGQSATRESDVFVRKDGTAFSVSYVASPITTDGKLVGAVIAFHDVTDREQLLASERQARISAEAAQKRLQALQSVTEFALTHLSSNEMLQQLLLRIRETLRVSDVAIVQPLHTNHYAALEVVGDHASMMKDLLIPVEGSLATLVMRERRPIYIEDVHTHGLNIPGVPKTIRSLLGVPLQVESYLAGVLLVATTAIREFTPEELDFLQVAGDRIAQALDRVRLFEEQRKAQHDADERASQLEAIFNAMTDTVILYNAEGDVVRANRAAHELFEAGQRPEIMSWNLEARGTAIRATDASGAVVPPERWPLVRVLRGEILTGGSAMDLFIDIPSRPDACFSFEGAPVRDADGQIIGAVLVVRDVTEQRALEKRALEAAREVARRASELEAVFESVPEGMIAYDAQGNITRMNPVARRLLAITDDMYTSYTRMSREQRFAWIRFAHVDGKSLTREEIPLVRVMRGETIIGRDAVQVVISPGGGAAAEIEITGAPIRDSQQRIVGGVIFLRDLRERNALERELLAHGRERERVFNAMADAVLVFDEQGTLRDTNEAGRSLFRIGPDVSLRAPRVPKVDGVVAFLDESGREISPDHQPVADIMRGTILARETARELTMRWPDGEEHDLSITGGPLRDQNDRITGGVLICRDVTKRRRLEREVARRAAELEALFESLSDGVAMYDTENNLVRANSAMRGLVAADWQEFARMPLEERNRVLHLRDAQGNVLTPEQWPVRRIWGGERLDASSRVELIIRDPAGKDRQLSVVGSPVLLPGGRKLGAVLVFRDISEQVALEREATAHAQEAAARASLLGAVFSAITDGVVVFDAEGNILEMNDADRRLVQGEATDAPLPRTTRERMALAPVFDSDGQPIPADQTPTSRVLRGETISGAGALDLTTRAASGQMLHINVSGSPIRGPDGDVRGGVVVWRDVTARVELERQLSARADELEIIIESIADPVVVYGTDGSIQHLNASAKRLVGFDLQSSDASETLAERGKRRVMRDVNGRVLPYDEWPMVRVLRGEKHFGSQAQDVWMRSWDGRDLLFSASGGPIVGTSGETIGGVVVLRDVTERRQLEARTHDALMTLVKMAETLVLSPEEAALVEVDTSGSPPFVASPVAWRLVALTRAFLQCPRISLVAVEGAERKLRVLALASDSAERRDLWLNLLHDARLSDFFSEADVARLGAGEIILHDQQEQTFSSRWPEGTAKSLYAPLMLANELVGVLGLERATPYTEAEFSLIGGVARLTALVLERDRLEREREDARASALALSQSNQRMDEFLSIASHELKTPITVLALSTHLMRTYLEDERRAAKEGLPRKMANLQRTRKIMHRAERQLARLNRFVDDLLDVTHVRVNRLELRLIGMNLDALVRRTVRQMQNEHPLRTITLQAPPPGTIPVYADELRIRQVLKNYLTNALKYSDETKPVEVSMRVTDREARVEVRDHGAGLTPDEQHQIWERFYRSRRVSVQYSSEIGLGLGLYVARAIIALHNGQIGVQSAVGQGSTFWFSLPLRQAAGISARDTDEVSGDD